MQRRGIKRLLDALQRGALALSLARPRPQLGHAIARPDRQAPDREQACLRLGRMARRRKARRMIIDTLNPKFGNVRSRSSILSLPLSVEM